jgi:hypothetical protein
MAGFDITKVNENSPLVKQFNQRIQKATGQMVVAFIPQKMKKVLNELTKDLDFSLENGQTITLVARASGDIVRVKLNGKDLPIKNELFHFSAESFQPLANNKISLSANTADRNSPASVFSKAVDEIAGRVRANQAAFDKRRMQEKVTIPKPAGAKSSETTASKTREIRQSLDELDKEILSKSELRNDLKQRLAQKQSLLGAGA